jgi:zinc/manganese transport system substrate-binding protein
MTLRPNRHDDKLFAGEVAYVLSFDEAKKTTTFKVEIEADGQFAFFTEHMPFEFEDKEHFFKDASGNDVEPIAQEPDTDNHAHGHDDRGKDKHAKDDHDDHGHDKHA